MKTPKMKSFKQAAAALLAVTLTTPAFAASQTWTNAPADNTWTNVNNWIAKAVPGALNVSGNTVNADVVTFTNPIPLSGIGGSGAADKGITPDGSASNGRAREIAGITFDGPTCGAYYIGTNGMIAPAPSATNGVLWVSHNQAIRMREAVATTQTILVPMNVILPSSTAGIFNLINNSTNGGALNISYIQHSGANTRATTFVLDGTNTADNIVTNLSEGGGNATGGITKQGPGKWIIAGPGTFPAGSAINVNLGTLVMRDVAAFGLVTTTVNVNTNGVLQIDGITPNFSSATLKNSGTIRMNGTATINGVSVNNGTGNTPSIATTSSGDVLTLGNVINKVTGGAADSVLNISGPGTVYLGNDNNYIGKWSVNAGTLQIASSSALGTGANLNIAAGGKFDLSPLGATTWNPTTAGIGGSGTGTTVGTTAATITADAGATIDLATGAKTINLTFNPTSFSGDTTHPALYVSQGVLALGGNAFNINNASGTPLGVGTYRIIQQASGSVADGGGYAANITGSGKVGGSVASIVVSGGNVDLVISIYVAKNLVWTGGAANANWNLTTDANWLNGLSYSVFNSSDNVTFNSVGQTNPNVNIVGTMLPGSVVVDTSANTYTFAGSGQIAGGTALTKIGSGTLNLSTVNTYVGGTVISNGVLQAGANNAVSGTGAGNVQVVGAGTLDLNGYNQSINALVGGGTVDTVVGGVPVLTIGNNDASGTFSGKIQNVAGTLSLTKVGLGTETLTGSNSYSGATTINLGTISAQNPYALGTGSSDLVLGGGTLDLGVDIKVNSLAAPASGTIANNSNTSTNTLYIVGSSTTDFYGSVTDGSGGGKVGLKVLGGSVRMRAANSYTGGTWVGSGATFLIGNNAGSGVTGPLVASNSVTLGMPGGSNPPGTPTSITTADGATVTFTSGALGNIWGGQFIGGATSTNRFTQNVSAGGTLTFSGFLGVVQFDIPGSSFRFFNGGGVSGSDNTRFEFINGNVFNRDGQTTVLGEISGGSGTSGIGGNSTTNTTSTWIIGGRNTDSTFHGYISSSVPNNTINNFVKSGTGRLTLDGVTITTNTDSSTFTNYLYVPLITYAGSTTVSNGVLAIVAPNNYDASTNSSVFNLRSSSSVLDVSQSGYLVDQLDGPTVTNQIVVVNSTLKLITGKSLNGIGTVRGNVDSQAGSSVNVGLGILNITNVATLNGVLTMQLNRTNVINASKLTAGTLINASALTVTNVGDALQGGDTFTLFNGAVTGFTATNLPTLTAPMYWTNNLAVNGTIAVVNPVATNPTNITTSVSGSTLTLSWPADHIGWRLQVQTNTLGGGINPAGTWFDVAGSTGVNTVNVPLDSANGAVFYRMVYP